MLNRLIILLLCLTVLPSGAQVTQDIRPASQQNEYASLLPSTNFLVADLPVFNANQAWQEDSNAPGQNRFAAPISTDISLENAGKWTMLPNGDRVWQCEIKSTNALALVLIFDQFLLPNGASFHAFSPDLSTVKGAYIHESCLPSGQFLIGPIKGDKVRLELYEPSYRKGQTVIHLNRVDHAYDSQGLRGDAPENFGESLNCNINVNCALGNNWQSEKRGVARILMVFSNGTGWCTGTLIANTANNFEPYFLTAHHCQLIGNNPDFSVWRFDFDYEGAGCSNPGIEPQPRSVLGCTQVSYRLQTDFMLLKLNPIPGNYNVYFNGWTRDSVTLPPSATHIHHPSGDIKKISLDEQALVIHPNSLNWGTGFGTTPPNSHWKSTFDQGTYQPGSSGGPLFDPQKRIIGQLHGGSPINNCVSTSYYGRFNQSWAYGANTGERLKEWLDPGNQNPLSQSGYVRPISQFYKISGTVYSHWDVPMPNVQVQLSGGATATTTTDPLGNYTFENVPVGGNYTVEAQRDGDDINGVTTFDLVLISKHVLMIDVLPSPWRIIAADINKSNSVTTFDIVEGRRLILGITPAFASNPSWRFWPASTVFSDPAEPFLNGLPVNTILITNLQSDQLNINFKGVKVGDTNSSATP